MLLVTVTSVCSGNRLLKARQVLLCFDTLHTPILTRISSQDAVVADALNFARAYAQKHKKISEEQKNDPKLLGLRPSTIVVDKVKLVVRENRPAVKFVDVGGRFLDVEDRLRRIKEGERRSKIRTRNREQKEAELKERKAEANPKASA